MSSTHDILCGSCKTPVQGPSEPADDDIIKCANCGQSDCFGVVLESITRYATDAAGRHLQQRAKQAVRGSKFITFKADPIPNRTYRWIVADLKL